MFVAGGQAQARPPVPSPRLVDAAPPAAVPLTGPAVATSLAADTTLMRGAQALPLDALVKYARDNAMRVRVARSRVTLGDAAVEGAKPLLVDNPQLYVGMGARVNPKGSNFEIQSTFMQPIEVGGERGLRIKAGRKYRELLDRELQQVQWETYAAVHYAYNMALLAQARADTATRTVAFSTRLLEITERRAQAGEISNLRVRIAAGELAQAKQAKLNADLEFRLACIHLSEIAGWPQGQTVMPVGQLELPVKIRDDADLIARLQAEHPAVRAREAAVGLGEARVKSADRDRLPEPWLGFYAGREKEPGGGLDSRIGLVTLQMSLPFWKRNQAARAQSRSELTIAEQELQALQYSLGMSARRAVEAVNTAAERVRTYSREVVPRFAENLDLLQRAFELGEVELIEVFVARENFLRIQEQALDAYRAYYDAVYSLESMLGSPLASIAG
ncbi:MAG: TolC family protein [Myxococcales bacterium]|nr:TolC family protein [Myxococcales bacterium]